LIMDIIKEERLMSTKDWLQVPRRDCWPDLVERLAELRRYEYASRFGDYFKDVYERLEKTALDLKTSHYQAIMGWNNEWTDIAAKLDKEKEDYRCWVVTYNGPVEDKQVATHLAIRAACRAMGANMDMTMEAIYAYEDRNSLVHKSVLDLVERGEWDDLKRFLVRDLLDLEIVTPKHLTPTIPILQSLIYAVIDRYWIRNPLNRRDQNLWNLRPQSIQLGKQLREDPMRRLKAIENEQTKIAALAADKYKRDLNPWQAAHFAAEVANLPSPTGSLSPRQKRPRDEKATDELVARNKRRDKEFKALVHEGRTFNKEAYEYLNIYRSLKPPVKDVDLMFDEEFDHESGPGVSSSSL
jgi:hypothetical protein